MDYVTAILNVFLYSIITYVIILGTIGCGDINVSDSEHRIVHTMELGDVPNVARELCEDRYPQNTPFRDELIGECTADLIDDLLGVINNNEVAP